MAQGNQGGEREQRRREVAPGDGGDGERGHVGLDLPRCVQGERDEPEGMHPEEGRDGARPGPRGEGRLHEVPGEPAEDHEAHRHLEREQKERAHRRACRASPITPSNDH